MEVGYHDASSSSRMLRWKSATKSGAMNIVYRFPRLFSMPKSFHFTKYRSFRLITLLSNIPQPPIPLLLQHIPGVEEENVSTGNRVIWCRGQLDNIEDWVKAFHGQGGEDGTHYYHSFSTRKGPRCRCGQFPGWSVCLDVAGIQVNSGLLVCIQVPLSFLVVIPGHVIFDLARAAFASSSAAHSTRKLIDRLHSGWGLIGFKTHSGESAGSRRKGWC